MFLCCTKHYLDFKNKRLQQIHDTTYILWNVLTVVSTPKKKWFSTARNLFCEICKTIKYSHQNCISSICCRFSYYLRDFIVPVYMFSQYFFGYLLVPLNLTSNIEINNYCVRKLYSTSHLKSYYLWSEYNSLHPSICLFIRLLHNYLFIHSCKSPSLSSLICIVVTSVSSLEYILLSMLLFVFLVF